MIYKGSQQATLFYLPFFKKIAIIKTALNNDNIKKYEIF